MTAKQRDDLVAYIQELLAEGAADAAEALRELLLDESN